MNRAAFKDAIIKEAVLVINFEPVSKIERYAYQFEDNLRSIFEKEVSLTKIPDNAPPFIPRFLLASKNRGLEVSEVNAVLKMTFKEIDIAQAFKLFLEKAKKIFDYIKTVGDIKIESFVSSALFHFSLEDPEYPVRDAIFDRFFNIEKPLGFDGVSFSLNWKIDDVLVKNRVDSYETRQKKVKVEAKDIAPEEERKVIVRLKLAEMEVVDKGLLNRIEIISDDIRKDDPQGLDKLFDKVLNWPKQYISEDAEQFIFGGK